MLDSSLIESQNAYRRMFSLEEKVDNYVSEEKLIDNENWEEHYVRKGDPSKSTYYIFRMKFWPGLMAALGHTATRIKYALSKGWIPVVDMQNYPSSYLAPDKFGKENAWEYYFEQPLRVGLEEAYNGENIILSSEQRPLGLPFGLPVWYSTNKALYSEWKTLVKLGLLKVKPEITEEVLKIRDKLFPPKKRILGAHLRGTDYLSLKPRGHSIPPPPNMQSK